MYELIKTCMFTLLIIAYAENEELIILYFLAPQTRVHSFSILLIAYGAQFRNSKLLNFTNTASLLRSNWLNES